MLRVFAAIVLAAACAFPATQVVMLGTGTPRPDPDRSGPAVAIVYSGKAYLFDCGPGVVRRAATAAVRLQFAELQAPKLGLVFVTHLHSDHTLGLPDLLVSPWTVGRKTPLQIYGPAGIRAMAGRIEAAWQQDIQIRTQGLEHGNATGHRAVTHEIQPGEVFQDGALQVAAFAVHHGSWKEALGYRITTPDKTIVISGDCAPSPSILKACRGCDVLLHEVYSLSELAQPAPGWAEYLRQFHTSTTEVATIAQTSQPKQLVLYHQLMRGANDGQLLQEVARTYPGPVASAHDFDVY